MKSINSLTSVLSLPILLLVTTAILVSSSGCKKPNDDGGGGIIPPVAKKPTVTVTSSKNIIDHGGKVTISWTSTDATSGSGQGVSGPNGSFQTDPLVGNPTGVKSYTYTVSVSGPGGSDTGSVDVKVRSQRSMQMQNLDTLRWTFDKSCIAGTEGSPSAVWYDWESLIPPNYWCKFMSNGGFFSSLGGGPDDNLWTWTDSTETKINFGLGDIWNVIVKTTGIERNQTKNGFYTLQKFEQ